MNKVVYNAADAGDSRCTANPAYWSIVSSAEPLQANAHYVDSAQGQLVWVDRSVDRVDCCHPALLNSDLLRWRKAQPTGQQVHQHSRRTVVRSLSGIVRLKSYPRQQLAVFRQTLNFQQNSDRRQISARLKYQLAARIPRDQWRLGLNIAPKFTQSG